MGPHQGVSVSKKGYLPVAVKDGTLGQPEDPLRKEKGISKGQKKGRKGKWEKFQFL